jgi:hypothetical protein
LSFFDDADEPASEPRGRRSSGTGRTPGSRRALPSDREVIQRRRALAVVGVVVAIVLIALLVHSCQVSQRNSALMNYNNNVSSVLTQSDSAGSQLFSALASGTGASNLTGLQNQINEIRAKADAQLATAKGFAVPSAMKGAQQNLVLALQMRRDAIHGIAAQIQPALGNSASGDAVNAMASDMARLYASDVVYKAYAAPLIASALNAAKIPGQTIYAGQFLPNVEWMIPSFVASELHGSAPSTSSSGTGTGKVAPGVHGHKLDSVSVNGTTLQTQSTNTIARSPAPTFTCTFENDGQNTETNVVVRVAVAGTSINGQAVVPQTVPGHQYTVSVQLSSSPPAGAATVTATVERVPGETVVTHNTQSFPVTLQ